jgi:predicted regulator of Ras-like GTPase activity (Roadblock/LC7/MglB family)
MPMRTLHRKHRKRLLRWFQRIRALDGVTGAFLATSDGLLIAGEVPDSNDNVLAAFAPTVFTQISKYSGMARLGVPEAVELHLSGAVIHVRKTGKLYLGVLMPHGRPVPLSDLDRISAALQSNAS